MHVTSGSLYPLAAVMQEAFDTVAQHLARQGGPARADGQCRYRTQDGRKCAVGVLIPDKSYHPPVEEKSLKLHEEVRCALPDKYRSPKVIDMLSGLQAAHDNAPRTTDDRWDHARHHSRRIRSRLADVAAVFGLDASIIDRAFSQPAVTAEIVR